MYMEVQYCEARQMLISPNEPEKKHKQFLPGDDS